jgi:hypothetical protein
VQPVVTTANLVSITVPSFMLGVSLIFVLSVKLNLLPSTGWVPWSDGIGVHLQHMIMPVLTLSAYYFGAFSIVYRAEYASVVQRQFIRVAQAKGLVASRPIGLPTLVARTNSPRLPCGLARFVAVQNHYNLLWREDERELLPFCRAQGIGLIPYSPMARGFLCDRARRQEATQTERGKTDDYTYKLYGRPADEAMVDRVAELAAARGVAPGEIALAWVLHQPGIAAPIIGATQPYHVDEAVAALKIALSDDELQRLGSSPSICVVRRSCRPAVRWRTRLLH